MRASYFLILFLVFTAALLIRAEVLFKRRQIYILKPISTLLVIAIATLSFLEPTRNLTYSIGIVIGLLLSFGGDMALMFQENRKAFTVGLGLFLLAHIAYTITFFLLGCFSLNDIFPAIILVVAGAGFYRLVQPNLGKMRIPVIFYILIISLMVSRAFAIGGLSFTTEQVCMIISGAVLFYISDVILALARFWRPWKYHRISLAFYYSGQLLLALAASFFS